LEVIKFVCKDFWQVVFKKQVDNLKTNHRVRAATGGLDGVLVMPSSKQHPACWQRPTLPLRHGWPRWLTLQPMGLVCRAGS
jgi:hypothetical protein